MLKREQLKPIAHGVVAFLFSLVSPELPAQDEEALPTSRKLTVSGVADVYYVYDFNRPPGEKRQPFFVNYNRHRAPHLNLGFIKLAFEQRQLRANLAVQAGTYANDNYAKEPGLLKNVLEANIGLSLNRKNNLWLDAGILPSYIGFESPLAFDNENMTRSILAENSPYFVTGVKLTYHPDTKWEIAALMVNGWQRIKRVEGNSLPSFGTQLRYRPVESCTLNWSSFMGTDDPDTTRRMRYFHNFYTQIHFSTRWSFIAGFDFGMQQRAKNSSVYEIWFSPIMIGRFSVSHLWQVAIRAEYYSDKDGIIIPTETTNGFRTTGLSFNLDYTPSQHILCRLEGRWLMSKGQIFQTSTSPTNHNVTIGTALAIRFNRDLNK